MPAEYVPLIVSGMVFLCVVLLLLGVMQLVRAGSRKRLLLQKIQGPSQMAYGMPAEAAGEAAQPTGPAAKLLGLLGLLGDKVARKKLEDHTLLRPRFLKAGVRSQKAPAVFWGFKVLLPGVLVLGFALFRIAAPQAIISSGMSLVLVILLALAGFYLPDLWLANKSQKRRQEILEGFPDALDLLVVCVEAGMGLDSAISRVAKESRYSNKTLSEELHLYNLETRAGMPRADALKNLSMRTGLQEMQNLTTLLIQTEKFGTSVSQALKVFSDSMRTQRFQRAEEKAAKIPVKLLFPLILFIFPALFVAILGPAVIRISQTLLQM